MDRCQIEPHRPHELALQLLAGVLSELDLLGIRADAAEDIFAVHAQKRIRGAVRSVG